MQAVISHSSGLFMTQKMKGPMKYQMMKLSLVITIRTKRGDLMASRECNSEPLPSNQSI